MSVADPIQRQGLEPTILVVDDNKRSFGVPFAAAFQTRAIRNRCLER